MEKGKTYAYEDIQEFAKESFYMYEHGDEVVGKHFICLEHDENDIIVSFILSGATATKYLYECIYSDIEKS